MHDEQVVLARLVAREGEDEQDHRDDQGADDGEEDEVRADGDAHGDGPEHVDRVHRVLDRGAEADDGQRAHHAHGELDGFADAHDHRRGDERHQDQRQREVGRIHHAAEVHAVHRGDAQAHGKGQHHGEQHQRDGTRADGLGRKQVENVAAVHGETLLFRWRGKALGMPAWEDKTAGYLQTARLKAAGSAGTSRIWRWRSARR